MSIFDEAIVLNDGSLIPKVGVQVDNDQTFNEAVAAGFRLIETKMYRELYDEKEEMRNFYEISCSI